MRKDPFSSLLSLCGSGIPLAAFGDVLDRSEIAYMQSYEMVLGTSLAHVRPKRPSAFSFDFLE